MIRYTLFTMKCQLDTSLIYLPIPDIVGYCVFFTGEPRRGNDRVSTVRENVREKNIFSRTGNCQGILKFVREFWNLSKSQGKVREF